MKSRAKTAEAARSSASPPKSIRPPAPARKTLPPPARKTVPPSARKSVPPGATRKSIPPAPALPTGIGKRPRAAAKAGKAGKGAKADADAGSRKAGMRGAAPWAARHAAKHAEEAAARMREPPKPGSARATLRTPDEADRIKQRISELHTRLVRIRGLRKNLNENFFSLGAELKHIQEEKLYEAKGYSSFETFAERELDLGKATTLKLARVSDVFVEAGAKAYGVEAVLAALDALDERASATPQRKNAPNRPNLPMKPPR